MMCQQGYSKIHCFK